MTADPKRTKLGIDLVAQGGAFKFGNLVISGSEHDRVTVTGYSNYGNIVNLTRSVAERELTSAKEEFRELITESSDLAEFVKGKPITFRLGLDYGMGALLICAETNGQITWHSELPS